MHSDQRHATPIPCIARTLVIRQLGTSSTACPGIWQISSYGRVCNTYGVTSFGSALPSGYCKVMIEKEQPFCPSGCCLHLPWPSPQGEDAWQVHHKDGNPANNHIANLEYVTASQNQSHSYASGTRRCRGPALSKPIAYRVVGAKNWTRCASVAAAALELGISKSAVSNACRGKTPLKGYEISAGDLEDPDLPGEEWKQMRCPVFGQEVAGKVVSSCGRFKTAFGCLLGGCVRKDGYTYTLDTNQPPAIDLHLRTGLSQLHFSDLHQVLHTHKSTIKMETSRTMLLPTLST